MKDSIVACPLANSRFTDSLFELLGVDDCPMLVDATHTDNKDTIPVKLPD